MIAWWTPVWAAAEEAFGLYLKAPVMNREGLRVVRRPSARYAFLEAWAKPRLIASML